MYAISRSNIGLPFYGRSFSGSGLTQFGQANDGSADTMAWIDDEGSPQCKRDEQIRFFRRLSVDIQRLF